jgi:hypothetical protein
MLTTIEIPKAKDFVIKRSFNCKECFFYNNGIFLCQQQKYQKLLNHLYFIFRSCEKEHPIIYLLNPETK